MAGPGPYAAFTVDRGVDVYAVPAALCAGFEVAGVPATQRTAAVSSRTY